MSCLQSVHIELNGNEELGLTLPSADRAGPVGRIATPASKQDLLRQSRSAGTSVKVGLRRSPWAQESLHRELVDKGVISP